jgi:cysteinyl-tRNA synthetase
LAQFGERMDDDLDTPNAMALLFDTVRRANAALDAGDHAGAGSLAAAVHAMCSAIGLVLKTEGDIPAEIAEMASALDAARAAKDFAAADALRAQLQGLGWLVETTKQGTSVRR